MTHFVLTKLSPKERELLDFLLLHKNKPVTIHQMMLWCYGHLKAQPDINFMRYLIFRIKVKLPSNLKIVSDRRLYGGKRYVKAPASALRYTLVVKENN